MHERHYHFYPYKESKDIGITRYRFVAALSERTCGTCGDLDGKVFEVEDAVEGKNYPPIHPNCRCATVMADAISSTRAAKDPLTGKSYKVNGNMTFNKWKDSLTDEQRAALKYVDKSAKSDIINYAKASDIFLYQADDIPATTKILPEHIVKNLETSAIGRDTIKYIQNNNVAIYINYEKQIKSDRGDCVDDTINIYMSNIQSERVAAQTVIHEVTHCRYDIGGCQWAEAVCMAQEKKHVTNCNELTFEEKRYIVKLAKDNYSEFNWKKGGHANGTYFKFDR